MGETNSVRKTVLAILIGVGLIGGAVYVYTDQVQALNTFEPVEAQIVDAHVDKRVVNSGNGNTRESFTPDITYEYVVDGTTYRSSNYEAGIGRSGTGQSHAEATVARYPPGTVVTAYYNPANPREAFLVKQQSLSTPLAMVGVGVLFVLVGVAGLVRRVL